MNGDHSTYPHPPLTVEVWGDYACFTRPELKSERFSYEVMTPSAAAGILKAIFWKPEFDYLVTSIEVLKPIRWFSVRRNEVNSMVTADWIRRAKADPAVRYDVEQDRDQRNTVGLRDVAYRVHAQVVLLPHATTSAAGYREQFRRRVDRGACFSQPFLGTREFSASFGRATATAPHPEDRDLGVMLHSIAYEETGETYRWFLARLDQGVLHVPRTWLELPASPARSGAGPC